MEAVRYGAGGVPMVNQEKRVELLQNQRKLKRNKKLFKRFLKLIQTKMMDLTKK